MGKRTDNVLFVWKFLFDFVVDVWWEDIDNIWYIRIMDFCAAI